MLKYCLKRIFQSLVSFIIVASIVFLMLRLMPEEGFFPEGAYMKMSDTAKMAVLQKLGLYDQNKQPINPFIQLVTYYKNIVTTFDLGQSTQLYVNQSVTSLLAPRLPVSMSLGLTALLISICVGYPLGIAMARYKNTPIDHLGMAYIVLVTSIPLIVYYFFVQFYLTKWLNTSMIYRSGNFMTYITPTICICLAPIARNALWIRRYMVDEFNKDYVKLAYAKGMPSRYVMYRHILRNAFIPMAYNLPVAVLLTLSGSIIMERLFSVPGMGRLFVDAINKRDNNLVQAIVMLFTALGILGVFLGDILAVIIDPRITLTKKEETR